MNFKCDRCGKTFPVGASFHGKAMHCPKCKEGKLVPSFHPAATAVAAAGGGSGGGAAAPGAPPAAPAASAPKPNLIKRHFASAQAAQKRRLSDGTRTMLTLAGIMGGCLLLVGLVVVYPILRDSGTPDERKEAKPAASAKAVSPAGGKATPPADGKESSPAPAEKDAAPPGDEKGSAPPAEEKASVSPGEEKAPDSSDEGDPAPEDEKAAAGDPAPADPDEKGTEETGEKGE